MHKLLIMNILFNNSNHIKCFLFDDQNIICFETYKKFIETKISLKLKIVSIKLFCFFSAI